MKLGLCSTVFIVLLVLKLCELIVIPWLWVFMPLIVILCWWIIVAVILMVVLVVNLVKVFKNE